MGYLTQISMQMGISPWLLIVLIVWSLFWKLCALWKSARKGSPIWFVVLAVINTVGILEILYIYAFSETGSKRIARTSKSKTSRKLRRRRR